MFTELNNEELVDLQLALALARDTAKNNSMLTKSNGDNDSYWEDRYMTYSNLMNKIVKKYIDNF